MLVIASSAGCSFGTASNGPEPGPLSPGTAQLTINGKYADRSEAVQCVPSKHLMVISIGGESPVAIAMVSNLEKLTVKSVQFHELNGFTGSYNDGLGGRARVTIAGSMYQISGSARGFNKENPKRPTTEEFTIEVSC